MPEHSIYTEYKLLQGVSPPLQPHKVSKKHGNGVDFTTKRCLEAAIPFNPSPNLCSLPVQVLTLSKMAKTSSLIFGEWRPSLTGSDRFQRVKFHARPNVDPQHGVHAQLVRVQCAHVIRFQSRSGAIISMTRGKVGPG